jgi:thiamine biosynthesis lipoprotein
MSVHTFETMGTVVSLRFPDDLTSEAAQTAVDAVTREFTARDERFSLYRADSEASRVARGELALTESSDEMRDAYAESLVWRDATGGAFTPHRPDGVIDLSGTIKADALRAAATGLRELGVGTFSINAGGDIVTAGVPHDGAWITGIANPLEPGAVLSVVSATPGMSCVATSGIAERGEHIWRRPDTDTSFVQATVCADDIMTADVLATAIIAGGSETLDLVTSRGDVGVLVVRADGSLLGNEAFRALVTPAST